MTHEKDCDKKSNHWKDEHASLLKSLDAPSSLPPPESFMDALDPIYRSLPTYHSLDEHLRGELRILLAEEARRWIKGDVPAGRTAKVHLALARRSGRPL